MWVVAGLFAHSVAKAGANNVLPFDNTSNHLGATGLYVFSLKSK